MGIFLGSSVEDPNLAIELLPALFMPQILFSGFFVTPANMPHPLVYIRYIFPLTYAIWILTIEEFNGRCEGKTQDYCQMLLDNIDAYPNDTWWYWLTLVGLFVFFRSVALVMLRTKASKFY